MLKQNIATCKLLLSFLPSTCPGDAHGKAQTAPAILYLPSNPQLLPSFTQGSHARSFVHSYIAMRVASIPAQHASTHMSLHRRPALHRPPVRSGV